MSSILAKARSWPLIQQTIVCDTGTQTTVAEPSPSPVPAVVQPVKAKKHTFPTSKLLQRHYYPEGGWGWVIIFCGTCIHVLNHGFQLSFSVESGVISTKFNVPPKQAETIESDRVLAASSHLYSASSVAKLMVKVQIKVTPKLYFSSEMCPPKHMLNLLYGVI
ncbi:hypothetical protein V9T40_007102 [Parthenolecanium corni]|uniref:Uncharacterized protein n=1 Tax=Parthenolecanium corni TaxID=536013 RepID=A0AAN9TTY1_9HEMI